MKDESAKSDPHPDQDGWLGDFRRGPAVFSVHRELSGAHPLGPSDYRIECNDGAGPRLICRFTDEPEAVPEWLGAWRGDQWCPWILAQAHRLIAAPENT
ncbi:hypothetical protein AB0B28_07135 [Glycomyces sp. NPDC046736]|uniref:hypothetical protein n=1 Tax=Glycomyces sp. NPDC046736 TaxID=3155615 RepID=UPI00340328AC